MRCRPKQSTILLQQPAVSRMIAIRRPLLVDRAGERDHRLASEMVCVVERRARARSSLMFGHGRDLCADDHCGGFRSSWQLGDIHHEPRGI